MHLSPTSNIQTRRSVVLEPACVPRLAPGRRRGRLLMVPDGFTVHQVDARLVARHGLVVGIVARQASPHAVAWRWWSGTAAGTALSEADAIARCATKSE
jgi:hypothetical protein